MEVWAAHTYPKPTRVHPSTLPLSPFPGRAHTFPMNVQFRSIFVACGKIGDFQFSIKEFSHFWFALLLLNLLQGARFFVPNNTKSRAESFFPCVEALVPNRHFDFEVRARALRIRIDRSKFPQTSDCTLAHFRFYNT